MFMVSFRLSRRRVVFGLAAVAVIAAVGTFGMRALSGGEQMTSAVPVSENAVSEPVRVQKIKAKTNEERVAFLVSCGWTVEEEPVEVTEVIIPEEFDEVYQEYNALQQTQGFDLTQYAGKRCKRYTYRITNYPDTNVEVLACLLMYGNRLVGGDVSSTDVNGFMQGLVGQ